MEKAFLSTLEFRNLIRVIEQNLLKKHLHTLNEVQKEMCITYIKLLAIEPRARFESMSIEKTFLIYAMEKAVGKNLQDFTFSDVILLEKRISYALDNHEEYDRVKFFETGKLYFLEEVSSFIDGQIGCTVYSFNDEDQKVIEKLFLYSKVSSGEVERLKMEIECGVVTRFSTLSPIYYNNLEDALKHMDYYIELVKSNK